MEPYTFRYQEQNYVVYFELANKYLRRLFFCIRGNDITLCASPSLTRNYLISIVDKHKRAIINMYNRAQQSSENSIYIFGELKKIKFENGIYSIETIGSYRNEQEKYNLLKRLLNRYIDSKFTEISKIMGVKHNYSYSIRNMKTRYGTNSWQTYNIAFSIQLVHFSHDIINSVIIHEFAHDFHRNHSDNFYQVVYKYCPNYDVLRRKMVKGKFK